MKAVKKLTALLLSVVMLLGLVVIVPTSAETTAVSEETTIKFNLLDMNNVPVTADFSDSLYPEGVTEMKLDVPQHTGKKQIVKNRDGKNVLRLDLNDFEWDGTGIYERIYTNANAPGYNEAYSIKLMDIPAAHVPYITSVNFKAYKSDDSQARVAYEFGVTDGASYSRYASYSNDYIWENGLYSKSWNPHNLRKVSHFHVQQYSDAIANSEYWDNSFTGLFLSLTAYTEAGLTAGTLEIEELSYTVTATPETIESFPITKRINLLDDLKAAANSDAILPLGVSAWKPQNVANEYAGTVRAVENTAGDRVLSLNFENAGNVFTGIHQDRFTDGQGKYSQVYGIKLTNIPAEHIPYIKTVNIKMSKSADSNASLAYEFGVTDGTYFSKVGYNNREVWNTTTDISAILDPNTLKKGRVWNVSYNWAQDKYDAAETWNKDFKGLFFTFAAYTPSGTAGTLDIEELSYTVSEIPTTEKIDMLDLSDASLGDFDTGSYPANVSEFKFPSGNDSTAPTYMYTGNKRVVTNAAGKKVLQLDLTGLTCGSTSKSNYISEGSYSSVYAIKLMDIPTAYIPYIQNIHLKLKKSEGSNARVVYEFGVTDGKSYSKNNLTANNAIEAAASGVEVDLVPTSLYKVAGWKLGWNSSSSDTWADGSYTGLFLGLTAHTEEGLTAGTITIEEISYTLKANHTVIKAMKAADLKASGSSLTLYNDITSNLVVDKEAFDAQDFRRLCVKFEFAGKISYISDYKVVTDNNGKEYYSVAFDNLAPHRMKDTITASLCAEYDDVPLLGASKSYCVADYCYDVLKTADTNIAELNTVAVDLLNYGAAGQIYEKYNTENLANAALTEEQKGFASGEITDITSVQEIGTDLANAPVTWRGATLNLKTGITMMFLIKAKDIDGLWVKIWDDQQREWIVEAEDFVKYTDGFYLIYFDGFDPSQIRDKVYLNVYDANNEFASNKLTYSIESYVYSKKDDTETDGLAELVDTLMKYGVAAKAYKDKQ